MFKKNFLNFHDLFGRAGQRRASLKSDVEFLSFVLQGKAGVNLTMPLNFYILFL